MNQIHPTAIIESGAIIGKDVSIGPWTWIEAGAVIGDGCEIGSAVRISGRTRMGKGNRVYHGATLGADPQDLSYTPENAKPLTIGDDNLFSESVNISCGIKSETGTHIGNKNLLMAFTHVGHDCVMGNSNIFANCATLAGHVEIANHAVISSQVAIHQFCHIGSYVMIGGITGVAQDVPPYVMADGHRARIIGLNTVGLRRGGFTQDQRTMIKAIYRILLHSDQLQTEALEEIEANFDTPEAKAIVDFYRATTRGVITST